MIRQYKKYYSWILLVFHLIGLILFLKNSENASLTYLNILLCAVFVLLDENNVQKKWFVYTLIVFFGFTLEWVGVHTGWLFGDYWYGNALGIKFLEIPLVIGLNWLVIVISSSAVVQNLNISFWLKIVLAGSIATFVDLLIEPVAMQYGFWSWQNNSIPVYNYLCWFVFSVLFSWLYLANSTLTNNTARYLLYIWIGFFTLLNII